MIDSVTFGPHFIKLTDEFDFGIEMDIEDNYVITSFNVDFIFPRLQGVFYTDSSHNTYKDFQLHFRSGENFSLESSEGTNTYTKKRLVGNLFALGMDEEDQLTSRLFGDNILMSYILNDSEERTYISHSLKSEIVADELLGWSYPWPYDLRFLPEHYVPYNFYMTGNIIYHSLENPQEDLTKNFITETNYYFTFNSCLLIVDPWLGNYGCFLKNQELNLSNNIDIYFDLDAYLRYTNAFTYKDDAAYTLTDAELKKIPLILTFTNDTASNYYFSDKKFCNTTDTISFVYSATKLDSQNNLLITPLTGDPSSNLMTTSSRVLHYSLDLNSKFIYYDDIILGAECYDKVSLPYANKVTFGFYVPYLKGPTVELNGRGVYGGDEAGFNTITTVGYYTNAHYLNLNTYINNNSLPITGDVFSFSCDINEYKFNVSYFYMHPYEIINNKYIYSPINGEYNKIDASIFTNIDLPSEETYYDLFLIPGTKISDKEKQEFFLKLDKNNSIITYSQVLAYEDIKNINTIDKSSFNITYTEALRDKIMNKGELQSNGDYKYNLTKNEILFFNTFGFLGNVKQILKDNLILGDLEFDDLLQLYWNYVLKGGNFRISLEKNNYLWLDNVTLFYNPTADWVYLKQKGNLVVPDDTTNNTFTFGNITITGDGILYNKFPFDYYHISVNSKEIQNQIKCNYQNLDTLINIPKSSNDGDWLVIVVDNSIQKKFSNLQSALKTQPIYHFATTPRSVSEVLRKFRASDGTQELIQAIVTEESSTPSMGDNTTYQYVTKSFNNLSNFTYNSSSSDLEHFRLNAFLPKKLFTVNQYSDNNKYLNINKNGIGIGLQESLFDESEKKFEISSEYTTYFYGKTNIFPVGSIYLTLTPDNPEQYFVGKWVPFGVGKTLIGTDSEKVLFDATKFANNVTPYYLNNPTTFSASNLTGGEEKHTLTKNELPKISGYAESIMTDADTNAVHATSPFSWTAGQRSRDYAGESGSGLRRLNFNIGNDAAHNNLPPYITCYMWLRIA